MYDMFEDEHGNGSARVAYENIADRLGRVNWEASPGFFIALKESDFQELQRFVREQPQQNHYHARLMIELATQICRVRYWWWEAQEQSQSKYLWATAAFGVGILLGAWKL